MHPFRLLQSGENMPVLVWIKTDPVLTWAANRQLPFSITQLMLDNNGVPVFPEPLRQKPQAFCCFLFSFPRYLITHLWSHFWKWITTFGDLISRINVTALYFFVKEHTLLQRATGIFSNSYLTLTRCIIKIPQAGVCIIVTVCTRLTLSHFSTGIFFSHKRVPLEFMPPACSRLGSQASRLKVFFSTRRFATFLFPGIIRAGIDKSFMQCSPVLLLSFQLWRQCALHWTGWWLLAVFTTIVSCNDSSSLCKLIEGVELCLQPPFSLHLMKIVSVMIYGTSLDRYIV